MKIGLIVPPFIPVPPERYGGTELFVANLAEGLRHQGHTPVVYTVGASRVACDTRWRIWRGKWPIDSTLESSLDDLEHSSWACSEAARECDLVHLNNAPGLTLSRTVKLPFVYTLHHPHEAALSRYYRNFSRVHFVAISRDQAARERLPGLTVVHHGLDTARYELSPGRGEYVCFVGRIAPIKGVHRAIEVARRSGIPLKIAGEIQPTYREYWRSQIEPELDRDIEYVGEVDLAGKNQLFRHARALLFPIEWEEPFGLVMLEAMACGVPVLAFARGAAPEVVSDGVSGWLCRDVADMAERLRDMELDPNVCRHYVETRFSIRGMVERYLRVYRSALGEDGCEAEPAMLREAS